MKKFHVSFWYYTDNRCEADVEAHTFMGAIALAQAKLKLDDWPTEPGFEIKIKVR
jgi:hypothetical protein